jgi:peptidoglycan/LPS O-acetylase OafA/YrhL
MAATRQQDDTGPARVSEVDARPGARRVTTAAGAGRLAASSMASRFGLAAFRRVTSSGRYVPEIDGLRFVGILSVYVAHLSGYVAAMGLPFDADLSRSLTPRVLENDGNVVVMFFVISGFVLALPFASHRLLEAKPVSLRMYFLRRVTRLEPPYALSMLLFFAAAVFYGGRSAAALFPHLAASLLYLHGVIYGTPSSINFIAWTLEVEVQFYILVPLLSLLFAIANKVQRRLAIGGLIVTAMVLQPAAASQLPFEYSLGVFSYLQYFLLGFLLADVYLTDWRSATAHGSAWDLVSLVGWPLVSVLLEFPHAVRWVFPPLTFALYSAALRGTQSRKLFSNPWITTIGGMCYTIYLVHFPVISFIGRHTIKLRVTNGFVGGFLTQFLLVTPFVLAISVAYFHLIEKPCMRPDWPRRLAAALRTRKLPQQTA